MNVPLVGLWKLVTYELRWTDGRVEKPFGNTPTGRLMYDESGRMMGQCLDPRRSNFSHRNSLRGSDAEMRAAFTGCIAYFGTYTLDTAMRTVIHHVTGSLFPNWIGRDQIRHFEVHGPQLTLRTPPIKTGKREVVAVLVWERDQ